jgi:hypothetical protein
LPAGTPKWHRAKQGTALEMSVAKFVLRLTDYFRRHGVGATIRRASVGVKRRLFSGRMVVFYCDLAKQTSPPVATASLFTIERLGSEAGLSQQDLQEMTSFWNTRQARRNIKERFAKGAFLWLVRSGDRVAGYGWTLQGCTIEPYYFPLASDDLHLFDFHVLFKDRGRGINSHLVTHILGSQAANCEGRAFIEAAEWNQAQLSSLGKTPFRCLGAVRSFAILGHTCVLWTKNDALAKMHKRVTDQTLRTVRWR